MVWVISALGVSLAIASEQEGVSCNDLTDDQLIDQISGNAVLNGVPVKIFPLQGSPE